LTANPARDTSPVWSPDGKWIAFLSRREGDEQTQIYLISPEGGRVASHLELRPETCPLFFRCRQSDFPIGVSAMTHP